jgi:hypothetical protein
MAELNRDATDLKTLLACNDNDKDNDMLETIRDRCIAIGMHEVATEYGTDYLESSERYHETYDVINNIIANDLGGVVIYILANQPLWRLFMTRGNHRVVAQPKNLPKKPPITF